MKSWFNVSIATVVCLTLLSVFSFSKANAQRYGEVSFDTFYDELSPYGYWDNDADYGDIWFPNVSSGFRPYSTNGYWTMTEYGNTWVSNYDWGWAPFHYGRWVHTRHRGWGWIPGYEWGPAWVDWRSGNGYYGWAPMVPRVGVHISIGLPIDFWVFTPVRHIYARDIYRHAHHGHTTIYNRTTVINNTYIVNNHNYYGGPSRRDMERTMGRRITVRNVSQSERPGVSRVSDRSVSIYRPDRDKNRTTTRREASRSNEGNNRANDRVSTNRNDRFENRRDNDRTTPSSSHHNGQTRREMHIDKEGNATIRDRSNDNTPRSTRSNISEQANRRPTIDVNRDNDRSARTSELQKTERPSRQAQVRNAQNQRDTQNRANMDRRSRSSENRSSRETTSPVQNKERGQSQPREQRQRQTTQPVYQVTSRSANDGGFQARQGSSRIGRSSSSVPSQSRGAASVGQSRGNNERGNGRR